MKRTMLMFLSLLAILACLVLPASVLAQGKAATHAQHATRPLTTCMQNPDDNNCDNMQPNTTGCWGYDGRIIHTSGWYNAYGGLMGTTIWRSNRCRTTWAETTTANGSKYSMRTGISNRSDGQEWWTNWSYASDIWSPMSYTSGESAQAEAEDGISSTYHFTPTYPF